MKISKKVFVVVLGAGCLFAGSAFAGHGGAHWGYTGHEGPEFWGDLAAKYAACKSGQSQSPINITGAVDVELPAIQFDYKDSGLSIINNGHTVQVSYDEGSSITVDGHNYKLVQFHFHTPSENQIESKAFPMEAHFVHADADGHLAVIGVMLQTGAENAKLADIWKAMPMEEGKTAKPAGSVNALDLMPANKDYYRFDGSLTTPPCSEGVVWMVMKDPITISEAQAQKFAQLFPHHNARPVQAVNGRTVVQ
jgi:carbonic anhydrase